MSAQHTDYEAAAVSSAVGATLAFMVAGSMSNSNAARAQFALVPQTFHNPADADVPLLDSWDDRRSSIRRTLSELSWLTQVRVKYGPTVSLIDLSAGGAQIETTSFRLEPGSTVVVQIAAESEAFAVPSLVLRSQVSRIVASGATYRTALAFKRRLDLPDLPEAETSDRDLNLVHEHARLNVALRRLDESVTLPGDATRPALTGVGRGALAAALAIMESSSGRRASGTFSRELSRLFRIISSGLTNGTAAHAILEQTVERMRRAVPAQVIRVVNGVSRVGIPSEATCFDVPSAAGGRAARLVVECPRGRRLDSEHLSFLTAAVHLVTLLTEIEQVMDVRDRGVTPETNRDLSGGWQRLVVRYLDGRLLKGFTREFAIAKGQVHVWTDPNGPEASRLTVPMGQLKAIFFVHDLEGDLAHRPGMDTSIEYGRRIEVTFVDGEVLVGTTLTYSQEGGRGFFVTPLDAQGNNVRIFVAPGAVRHVKFPLGSRAQMRKPEGSRGATR